MDWQTTESSQIKQFKHDPNSNTLTVEFRSGGIYEYSGVTEEKFNAFRDADSHGKHLGTHIKGQHSFKRLN